MPTFVKETKYQDAYWKKTSVEYRITLYEPSKDYDDDFDSSCDHSDVKAEALKAAADWHKETGFPAIVERLVWTVKSFTGKDGSWDDWDGWGPKEELIWKSPDLPESLGFED